MGTVLENLDDESLIANVKKGDRRAEEFLLQKYSYIVKKEARFLFLVGAESEDLIQEGMIGLVKAIRTYSEGHDTKFSTFATRCVKGQLCTAVKTASRKKHIPLNSYISIYSEEKDDTSLLDVLSEENSLDPEVLFVKQEREREMHEKLDELLSPFEKKVVKLYLQGIAYSEIGHILGKEEKSIQNAISRIRAKVQRHEDE